MVRDETCFTSLELKTPNNADVNPATTPRKRPYLYWKSNEKMMYKPTSTIRPKTSSYFFSLVLLNQGSSKAAHSELVANPTRLTETLATLADPKNASQCRATMHP